MVNNGQSMLILLVMVRNLQTLLGSLFMPSSFNAFDPCKFYFGTPKRIKEALPDLARKRAG